MLSAWTRAALRPLGPATPTPAVSLARALVVVASEDAWPGARAGGACRKRRRRDRQVPVVGARREGEELRCTRVSGNGKTYKQSVPFAGTARSFSSSSSTSSSPSPPSSSSSSSSSSSTTSSTRGTTSGSPPPSFDPATSTSVASAAADAAAPQSGKDGGFGINNSKPLHLSIQDRFLEENGARKKKGLSLDSRLRIMRMLERMDEENKSGGAHDLFSRRFAHLKSRSEMDFQEFLLADTDGDGRVSNAEWEAFLRKKSLAEAGLEFQEPSALNVEIPLSVQQFSAMADENEGLHVSINGMRYRLTLQPEGRTADVIEHKQERLHDTLVELASMEREKRPLDAQAARHTKRVLTVCLLYLLSQAAVIAKLTFFSRFGWDVMEPITYFITFGTAILGLVFFQYHKIEYSYPALAALLTQRRATKLYVRNGFDISRYTELQSLALKFERQLVVLQPPRSLWSAAAIEENELIFASLSDEDVENAAEAAKDLNGPGKPNEHP